MMAFTTYEHKPSSPILQKALQSSLPYSINLVYRTQHSNITPDAHVLSTIPPDATEIPHCWAAAYLDRSMRPETELWVYASGEEPDHSTTSSDLCPECKVAVLSLFDYMSTLPRPPLHPDNQPAFELAKQHEKEHPETGVDVRYPISPGSYLRHLLLPSVITLGACHHKIVQILTDAGLVREEFPGRDAELNKFLFKVSNLPQTRELPEGLNWGKMRENDMTIVQARTAIPRSTRTLMSLESVGVFEKATREPKSWTFLGLDGSLTTLHTEPEYRGMGIAKTVAARIFKEYAPALAVDQNGTAWAHADVYAGNVQSEAVCRSLGGEAVWKLFWIRIDIDRAGKLAGGN
jgi:hypothetical protein